MTDTTLQPAAAVLATVQQPAPVQALLQPPQPVQVLLAQPSHVQATLRPPEAVVATLVVGQGPAGPAGMVPVEAVAAQDMRAGQPAYLSPANGQALLAHTANNITAYVVGLVDMDVQQGFVARLRTDGSLAVEDWTAATGQAALAPGGRYFLGAAPGSLTTTPDLTPGRSLAPVGVASAGHALAISLTRPTQL